SVSSVRAHRKDRRRRGGPFAYPRSWLAANPSTARRVPPIERSGVAVGELPTQPTGQVPLAAADVRAAVDDGRRDDPAVRRVPEGDPRPARQAAVRDADEGLGQRQTTGRALAVEARAVPRYVAVMAPSIAAD